MATRWHDQNMATRWCAQDMATICWPNGHNAASTHNSSKDQPGRTPLTINLSSVGTNKSTNDGMWPYNKGHIPIHNLRTRSNSSFKNTSQEYPLDSFCIRPWIILLRHDTDLLRSATDHFTPSDHKWSYSDRPQMYFTRTWIILLHQETALVH